MRDSARFDCPLAVPFIALLLACDIGAVPSGAAPEPDDPAGVDPAGEGAPDAGPPVEIACDDPVPDVESGEHNAGRACLDCHDGGGEAPTFRLAGTIYSALNGGTPVVGATVRVSDAGGAEHIAISARNGNFWIEDVIALPVQVSASSCPSAMPMAAPAGVGNCNASGCHDADFRIHLP
jgi:hypothetical protein